MQRISKTIEEALKKVTEEEEKENQQPDKGYNRSSELGWVEDCVRRLVLLRLEPDKQEIKESDKRRLKERKKQELLIRKELEAAGFKLEKRGRLYWPEIRLTGEIDDMLIADKPIPLEYKTAEHGIFLSVKGLDYIDLKEHRFMWIRHYPAQVQAYLLLLGLPIGVLVFKNIESGEYHFVDVPLERSYALRLLEGLKYVNNLVEKQDIPKAEEKPACAYCSFYKFCFGEKIQANIEVVNDLNIVALLDRYFLLKDKIGGEAAELERLEKKIKDMFSGKTVIIGNEYIIKSKEIFRTTYKVPEEIKAKYAEKEKYFRVFIERIESL